MTWKLPSHLEPYRGLIIFHAPDGWTLEDLANSTDKWGYMLATQRFEVSNQIGILQRLYDAGKLK